MTIRVLIAVILVAVFYAAGIAEAAPSLNNETTASESELVSSAMTDSVKPTESKEKEAESPKESERVVEPKWQDNPNQCTDKQWITKEPPFNCIDKPVSTAKAVSAGVSQGCEAYRSEISKYNWNVDVALKVMRAESGCNPGAVGDNRVIGGIYAPSCGLFQIRTLQGRPSCSALQNVATNVSWAYRLYSSSGWQPWSVCKNGMVACY